MLKFFNVENKAFLAQATLKRTTGVNGSISLSGTIFDGKEVLQGLDYGWRLFFDNQYFVITYKKLNDEDKTVEFDAIQQFFWDFSKTVLYQEYTGSHTFEWYLHQLFDGSGYTFNLQTTVTAFEKENWGLKNKLDLFNDIIEQAEAEFEVSNQNIIIRKQVGSELTGIVRQGINLSDMIEETDISGFATYVKGYGKFFDEDDHSKGRLETEYTSPLAKKYGKLDMDPYQNENFSIKENFEAKLKSMVDATYSFSLSLDIYDLLAAGYPNISSPQVGDWIMAVDEKLNFKKRVRIIKLEEDFDVTQKRIGYTATCGTLSAAENYQSSLNKLTGKVEQIQKDVTIVQVAANGKNKIYRGPDDPRTLSFNNLIEGDQYWQKNGDKVTVWMWDGTRWEDVVDDATGEEVKKAVEQAKTDTEAAKELAQSGVDKANAADEKAQQGIGDAAKALSDANVVSKEVTELKGGSTATLAQLENGLKQTVSNGDFESYRAETAQLIQDKVSNDDFASFRSQTVDALQDKVASSDFETVRTQLSDQITNVVTDLKTQDYNLLRNGAFNNVKLDNWRVTNTDYRIVAPNGNQPFANNFIQFRPNNQGNFDQDILTPARLKANDWNLNFYFLAESGASGYANVYLKIDYNDGTSAYLGNTRLNVGNAWQHYEIPIKKTDLANIKNAYLRFNFESASGGMWYLGQLQINPGLTAKPYTENAENMAVSSQITQLADMINLRVVTGDLINQINLSKEGILIDGAKTHITNETTIDKAVITSAMIRDIKADQITAGTLNAANVSLINVNVSSLVGDTSNFVRSAWNGVSQYVSIDASGIIVGGGSGSVRLGNLGINFTDIRNGLGVGEMHSNWKGSTPSKKGVLLGINYEGDYFSLGSSTGPNNSDYNALLEWRKSQFEGMDTGFHFFDKINFHGQKLEMGNAPIVIAGSDRLMFTTFNYANAAYPALINMDKTAGLLFGSDQMYAVIGGKVYSFGTWAK